MPNCQPLRPAGLVHADAGGRNCESGIKLHQESTRGIGLDVSALPGHARKRYQQCTRTQADSSWKVEQYRAYSGDHRLRALLVSREFWGQT